ncbi:hypothetical protein ACLOAU_13955 [Niabella sp. CJ426]|jgi:hypothetical protein|uniref:hypothetical protein n=1 Tax=Niabella sp. CJ426 TaxID=3393740 RepID=UPI003D035064
MEFTKLVPNVFYDDISVGLDLFVGCLDFTIGYDDLESQDPCCVIDSGELSVFLIQNKEFAEKDRPELRLHTTDIEAVYNKVKLTHSQLLHPNLNAVTLRPWGAKEFALRDASGVCIIIQQWQH